MAEHADDTSLLQPSANAIPAGSLTGFANLGVWMLWIYLWVHKMFSWVAGTALIVFLLVQAPLIFYWIWMSMLQLRTAVHYPTGLASTAAALCLSL